MDVQLQSQKNETVTKLTHVNEKGMLINNKYIIAMDNYFTRPKVITALQDLGISIVGTAKYQHGCPTVYLNQLTDTAADSIWMDN